MKLSNNWVTVTPFSKYLAMILFIALPLFFLYLGLQLGQKLSSNTTSTQKTLIQTSPVENERSLLIRCGPVPKTVGIKKEKFRVINGPMWAPDCRHIAWSVWQSGVEGMQYTGPYPYEGLFVYDDRTNQTVRVLAPKNQQETPIFKNWTDRETVIYISNQVELKYKVN